MKNLRKIREKLNINQLKLAMDIGVSQESISKYENDTAFPSKEVLVKLADYLNCSIDYLLDRTDNPKMNKEETFVKSKEIEDLIFRYTHLSEEKQYKLQGCLFAIEKEQEKTKK